MMHIWWFLVWNDIDEWMTTRRHDDDDNTTRTIYSGTFSVQYFLYCNDHTNYHARTYASYILSINTHNNSLINSLRRRRKINSRDNSLSLLTLHHVIQYGHSLHWSFMPTAITTTTTNRKLCTIRGTSFFLCFMPLSKRKKGIFLSPELVSIYYLQPLPACKHKATTA